MQTMRRLAIYGPGLLGGSLAMAARKRRLAEEIVLWGRREASLTDAAEAGVADVLTTDAAAAAEGADVVILCVPVACMAKVLKDLRPGLRRAAVVTDVGSVKGPVVSTLRRLLKDRAHWIGSHPMAGSEQSGFSAASAMLFEGAVTVLTPTDDTFIKALHVARRFWKALGCEVLEMDPRTHDRHVAGISHLPHLTASALVNAARPESLPLVGNGFRDATRIAAGPPEMWTDILLSNRTAVRAAIKRLQHQLSAADEFLARGDEKGLHRMLAHANHVRSRLKRSSKS